MINVYSYKSQLYNLLNCNPSMDQLFYRILNKIRNEQKQDIELAFEEAAAALLAETEPLNH